MRIVLYIMLGGLAGCQGIVTEEPQPPPAKPDIAKLRLLHPHSELLDKAGLDLAIVQNSGSEWLIRDFLPPYSPLPLQQLMLSARTDMENKAMAEADRKALLISRLARMAWQQHAKNKNIRPAYPEPGSYKAAEH